MLKKTIKYEDYNGNEVSEDFYFHLSKAELVEMELSSGEGGFVAYLQRIIASRDSAQIIKEFKDLVLKAYGQKSEDGRRFIKTPELREEFLQTAAYSQFFTELALQDGAASEFVNGIVPQGLSKDLQELTDGAGTVTVELPPEKKDPKDMTREELLAAFQAKNEQS